MAFLSFLLAGACSYDNTLTVSGNGNFYFDYANSYLYVTDEGASSNSILKIYDMGDPSGPVLKSTTSLPNGSGAREPRVFSGKLFIPYFASRHLAIWNINDPAAPTLISQTSLPDSSPHGPASVAVIGTTACVGYGLGFTMATTLQKLDISDPTNPSIVASLRPWNPAFVSSCVSIIANRGDFIACGQVTGGSSVPYIATIDPATFTTRDTLSLGVAGGSPSQLVADTTDGNYAYMYNGNNGQMHTIDITDHTNISEPSAAVALSSGSGAQHCTVSCPDINRLYMGKAGGSGLQIYILDITTRSAPSSVGTLSTSSETVTCMRRITDGCAGFAWGQGTGAAIHLRGTPPLS